MTDEEKRTVVKTVIAYRSDIERTSSAIADVKERMDQELRDMPEFDEWFNLNLAATEAKKRLAVALKGNGEYNNLTEELATLKSDRRDQQDILSTYVVSYAVNTKEVQLEIDKSGDALPIILKGKLGKPEKYQTNLFKRGA